MLYNPNKTTKIKKTKPPCTVLKTGLNRSCLFLFQILVFPSQLSDFVVEFYEVNYLTPIAALLIHSGNLKKLAFETLSRLL